MAEQNYANHARIDTGYHRILLLVQLACLTGSGVNLWRAWPDHAVRYSASLLAAAFLVIFVVSIYARLFALKAQDRAIRAEENLRHFALTGKLLDENKSPSRKVGEIDNRGSQFYLSLYWAQALAAQSEDAALAAKFAPLAKTLADNEAKIVDELRAVQGKPADIGGYYLPEPSKLEAVMRPSATFNAAITALV